MKKLEIKSAEGERERERELVGRKPRGNPYKRIHKWALKRALSNPSHNLIEFIYD